jgi:hypothetical protein
VPGYGNLTLLAHDDVATTYRASRGDGSEPVAVTVFRTDLASAAARSGYRDGQAAARRVARVANLLEVLETGCTRAGKPYVVTPLGRGHSLADMLAAGPLPVGDALRYLVPVARALHAVHELGLCHDDIGPDRIMLVPDGRPMLGDILTAHLRAERRLAATGQAPLYTAPEVLRGWAPTPRSDVYSLAATAFCLLSGRPPYPDRGGVAGLLLSIGYGIPPTITRADVPLRLRRLLSWALDPDPRTRCPDAPTFAEELSQVLGELDAAESATTAPSVPNGPTPPGQGEKAGPAVGNRPGRPAPIAASELGLRRSAAAAALGPAPSGPPADDAWAGDTWGDTRVLASPGRSGGARHRARRRSRGRRSLVAVLVAVVLVAVVLVAAVVDMAVWQHSSMSSMVVVSPATMPVPDQTPIDSAGTPPPTASSPQDTTPGPGGGPTSSEPAAARPQAPLPSAQQPPATPRAVVHIGFESGLDGWAKYWGYDSLTLSRTTAVHLDGSYALKLQASATGYMAAGTQAGLAGLRAGSAITFQVYADGPGSVHPFIMDTSNVVHLIGTETALPAADGWLTITFTVSAGMSVHAIGLQLYAASSTTWVGLDDLSWPA